MPRLAPEPEVNLTKSVSVRVIYGDTDRMGVVYHATYLRYMEAARVELIRSSGIPYSKMERDGYGLPVTDVAVSYRAPAVYDDVVSCYVGLSRVGFARLHFDYKLVVEPGDREGLEEPVVVLTGQTRHGCVGMEDGRPVKMPDDVHAALTAVFEAGRQG